MNHEHKKSPNLKNLPRKLLYDVVQLFAIEGKGATEVFNYLELNYPREVEEFELSREKVYPIVHVACEKQILICNPQLPERDLRELVGRLNELVGRLNDKVQSGQRIDVVEASRYSANSQVTDRTVEVLLDLIDRKHQADPQRRIILGVGGGMSVQAVIEKLGARLRFATRNLVLRCQSLIPGFTPHEDDAPVSYSRFFKEAREERGLDIDFFGLSAAPFVWDKDLTQQREQDPFMQEAFENAKHLDIVITGIASVVGGHRHGTLARTFDKYKKHPELSRLEKHLIAHKWLGDIHYCPFNAEGPVPLEGHWRPMSLVTIDDLKNLVRQRAYVVLCAGFCNVDGCDETRTAALYPLVRKPQLKGSWTHIVTECQTARELKSSIDSEPVLTSH